MARFLTNAQVNECVSMEDMVPAVEAMMGNHGAGEAANLSRRRIATPGGYLAVMGGAIMHDGVFGVKTFTNTRNGYSFQVSLYDAESGELLLYTQANRLGQLRTGATTAVAVKHLANQNAGAVGIVGTGNQAGDQLRAVSLVREISEGEGVQPQRRQPPGIRNADDRRPWCPGDRGRHERERRGRLRRGDRHSFRADRPWCRASGCRTAQRDRSRPDPAQVPRGGRHHVGTGGPAVRGLAGTGAPGVR